jgi:long-chain acyl-CoA synthetase
MATETIAHRIQQQGSQRPDAPAYHEKQGGQWKMTTWRGYADQVRTAGKALIALGLEPGQTVCILGFNAPEWTILDVATLSVGGAPAGIYTTCSAEEVQYIVHHADSPLILIEDASQWEKIKAIRAECPALKHVVTFRKTTIDDPSVMTWDDFLAQGAKVDDAAFDARMAALGDDDLATLIYTSGTTGPPKGVMLSHKNLAWTAEVAQQITGAGEGDSSLSYLPLSHIAEQMFTIHVPATVGSEIYYAESIDAVPENLKEVQPTIFFGVPRIWEKFHAGISSKLAAATGAKEKLVAFARRTGSEVTALKMRGQEPSGLLAIKYALANKLIFSKLKPAIGLGKARICVSGAAPIAREVLEFFASLDLLVTEVYGQSEGSGPTSFNLPNRAKFGSVGPALPGVDVRIAEDEEVLVRGPNVFLGYYKEPEATAETLVDGWLHSGDLGKFDEEGFLHIIGRKKDIIITAGGKNITPKNIESALKNLEPINEAVMIGDRRKFCSALVTLDPEWVERYAAAHQLDPGTLHDNAEVRALIQEGVDAVNAKLARVEQIKRFAILPRNLTVEDRELTPTLKVKRRIVYENWANLIESLYAE